MATVGDIAAWMERAAPLGLSEEWDNTGLLLGDPATAVERVMTCLTLTPESVDEALERHAEMVIAHHPMPFQPLRKITTLSLPGRLVWQLARGGVAVYSPHTAWDSARQGINASLADMLELQGSSPLVPADAELGAVGGGRCGELPQPQTLPELAQRLARQIPECRPQGVDGARPIRKVAIACGSGGSLLAAAIQQDCDLFLTGEATFHTCLEAKAHGLSMLLIGHFASERFAMERLATMLSESIPAVNFFISKSERDPVRLLG